MTMVNIKIILINIKLFNIDVNTTHIIITIVFNLTLVEFKILL